MGEGGWLLDGASTPVVLAVALLSLAGALGASILAKSADRRLHAREILLKPAEEFARNSLAALASLREITPPPAARRVPHRNEALLTSPSLVEARMAACYRATDAVRISRSAIRLVFTPRSYAAAYTQQVLAALRAATETAEQFYGEYEGLADDERAQWREGRGHDLRGEYKAWRSAAYVALDRFYYDVATRLQAPTWNPRRIQSRWSEYESGNISVTASVIEAGGRVTEHTAQAKNYDQALKRIDDDAQARGAQISRIMAIESDHKRLKSDDLDENPRHSR